MQISALKDPHALLVSNLLPGKAGGVVFTRARDNSFRHIVRLAACSLGWIGLLASCKPFDNLKTVAVVLTVEGNATVAIPRQSTPQPLNLTTRLPTGSRVITGPTGKVVIRLLPGIQCAVGPDSDVGIEELRFAKPGNDTSDPTFARTSKVALSRGALTCWITDREQEAVSKLSIQTATGTIEAIEDSVFIVKNSGVRARVICVRGKLRFTGAGNAGARDIEQASFYEWPCDGGPGQVRPADADEETQVDTALALETASTLQLLGSVDEDKLPTR